ncbi:MAG: hypothetical protein IT427_00720 [Pirellulales bacterium]|nr:hypothetical protein [Pirellulales bacterium]
MRKIPIVPVVLILLAPGCESLRRVEVWKQQTFFSPSPQSVSAPSILPPAAAPLVVAPCPNSDPTVVDSPDGSEESQPLETLLPGPVENVSPGPTDDGPML